MAVRIGQVAGAVVVAVLSVLAARVGTPFLVALAVVAGLVWLFSVGWSVYTARRTRSLSAVDPARKRALLDEQIKQGRQIRDRLNGKNLEPEFSLEEFRKTYLEWHFASDQLVEDHFQGYAAIWEAVETGVSYGSQATVGDYLSLVNRRIEALQDIRRRIETPIPRDGQAALAQQSESAEREEQIPEPRSPIERLRAALNEAIDLRAELNEAEPSEWSYGRNDPVLLWAKDTWELIREHFTEYADEFWGPDMTGLSSPYFATAYSIECRDLNRDGRYGYLERRIYLLGRILRETRG